MRKDIGIGAVGAVFQITLLIIRPDWVWAHWPYLVGLWVLAIGLWLLAMFRREKTEELPTTQTGAIQNSGQMVAPVFSGIERSTFHITTSATPASPSAVSYEPLSEPLPKAKLIFSGYEVQPLVFRMGMWSPYHARNTSVIVWIENKVAEEGESSEPAYVAATIKYVGGGSNVVVHIPRAYWIRKTDNVVTINVGGREGIVLGTRLREGLWEVYDNPQQPEVRFTTGLRVFKNYRSSLVLFEHRLKIDLWIIDPETGHTLKRFPLEAEEQEDGTLEIRLSG
jgi:hypothetical protein